MMESCLRHFSWEHPFWAAQTLLEVKRPIRGFSDTRPHNHGPTVVITINDKAEVMNILPVSCRKEDQASKASSRLRVINTLPVFLALPVPPYGTDPCQLRRWKGVDSCPIWSCVGNLPRSPAVRAVQSSLSFSWSLSLGTVTVKPAESSTVGSWEK